MTDNTRKPHAESCDQNAEAILEVIHPRFEHAKTVLEIGSGTGQHAVRFAPELSCLTWQPSDLADLHPGMMMWLEEANLSNVLPPLALDVFAGEWPVGHYDAIFTANTLHIVSEPGVEKIFKHVARHLAEDGCFLSYGPFMYNGEHTCESNIRFDEWLHSTEATRGVRDVRWLEEIAAANKLKLAEDVEMPANNRTLVWRHI